MKNSKRRFIPTSLEKRFMAIFVLAAALSWAAFRYLPLIPALAVLESHPSEDGFVYTPPVIRTSDEIELLSDAIKRMAEDIGRR